MRYLLLFFLIAVQTTAFGYTNTSQQENHAQKILTSEKSDLNARSYHTYRYYFPESGIYVSQDPLQLDGEMPNMYAYSNDVNTFVDTFGLALINGIPENPGTVRRFMSKKEYKAFKKNGFTYDPTDSRGGISTTSTKIKPRNPDALKRSTGALGADYYVDIDTRAKNVELKGMTKGGVPDWKVKDNVSRADIVGSGKVCK